MHSRRVGSEAGEMFKARILPDDNVILQDVMGADPQHIKWISFY
jgi:hypothetical protein